jgi:LacI family transcriptional regulator
VARGTRRGVTISDVARQAGVSAMTVSRVINGKDNVRDVTRLAVTAAIAALKFSPNPAARALAGADLVRIGLLYANPSTNYLGEFLLGSLEEASRRHDMLVVEWSGGPGGAVEAAACLVGSGIDGLLLPPPLSDFAPLLRYLERAGVPAVAVAAVQPPDHLSAVCIDDFEAARAMTRHLVTLGHRRIGFIRGNPDQVASAARFDGFRRGLTDATIPPRESWVAPGLFTYQSGLAAAEQLLAGDDPPTAIFASNDDMAAACIAVAHRSGYEVPRHLTVVGFDDTPLAGAIWPRLTTVRQPVAAMARDAVKILRQHVLAERSGADAPIQHCLLAFELVQRESDGPPRPSEWRARHRRKMP